MVTDIYMLPLRCFFLIFWRYAGLGIDVCPWSLVKLLLMLLLLITILDSLLAYLYPALLIIVCGRCNRRFVK